MGVIRGILLVLVTVLLFLSIISANLFWTLNLSLSYENVERESAIIAKDFLREINVTSAIRQISPIMNAYCKNHSNYVFNYQGYTFDVPCDSVALGENAVIEEGIKDLVKSVYYTKYDCNFLDCVDKSQIPLFLVSEKAHEFWKNNLYISLIISLVLLALVFLLVEKKTNFPILAGSLLILSSLIFIKLDSVFALFSDSIIFKFLGIFFSMAYSVSLRILITGAALIVLGIVLKVFKIGFGVSNLFSKLKQKKAEISKKKDKKKKSK